MATLHATVHVGGGFVIILGIPLTHSRGPMWLIIARPCDKPPCPQGENLETVSTTRLCLPTLHLLVIVYATALMLVR